MKIAVLYGGVSGEREVSLETGKGVIKALEANGHEVVGIDFSPDRIEEVQALDVDLVFLGLHGRFGEDGCVQGLLEMLNIPYVGSKVLASALAMDKAKAKQIFEKYHIPTAKSEVFHKHQPIGLILEEIKTNWQVPFVIKPNREGSTLGLSIIKDMNDVEKAVTYAFESDSSILIEKYISGRELTVPIMGNVEEEKALPIIEIIPKNELYDYEAKYSPGGSEFIVPAQLDKKLTEEIKKYAVLAHQALGCSVYSRVDFLLDKNNKPFILEVNTLPGMTETSLFPQSANSIGITYEEMIEQLVQISINANNVQ